jgi:two-component system, chemotaxis family, sensor kinase CheA
VSSEREALLERFRAGLLSRIERVETLLGEGEAPAGGAPREALGELHTLKGEGRMLGLSELAELTHALEGRLAHDGAAPVALRALDAMRRSLSETVEAEVGDAVLRAVRLELDAYVAPTNGDIDPEHGSDTNGASNGGRAGAGTTQPETTGAAPGDETGRARGRRFIQVDAASVDALCERLAELSADFGRLRATTLGLLPGSAVGARARAGLLEDFARVGAVVTDSTTRAWSLRLVPVEPVLRELRRHARLLASEAGKAIAVRIEARGVELERNVLDQVWDSLLHLVQNAVDHGLEPEEDREGKAPVGSLLIAAQAAGPNVVLSVEDDGRGIDPDDLRRTAARTGRFGLAGPDASDEEILDLVFEDGFSTREEVSSLSGRGVGLSVVRRQVEGLGGTVRVQSTPGEGTRFILTVPFTITKERSLVVAVGSGLFGFPARIVRAVLGAHELPAPGADRKPVLRFDGETMPLVSLARALELGNAARDTAAVVLELSGRRFGVTVAAIVGDSELIRRPADALLGTLTGVAATALLDDGRLVLMLELGFLLRSLRETSARPSPLAPVPAGPRRRRVLVADDSPVVCQLVQEILVSAGYTVELVHDGTEALAAIQQQEPDLVMSDMEMPKMGGLELLAEIRRKSQKLPVIMLTTRGSVEDRQRATELGANAYLLKTGFKNQALLDLVTRFLPTAVDAKSHAR